MTVDQILNRIEDEIAELEMILDWIGSEKCQNEVFTWYAAQQYALEKLRDRIKMY